MTLYACMKHSPMHVFGRGYVCAICHVALAGRDIPVQLPSPTEISEETKRQLDAIDANIRNAAIKAKDTWLD